MSNAAMLNVWMSTTFAWMSTTFACQSKRLDWLSKIYKMLVKMVIEQTTPYARNRVRLTDAVRHVSLHIDINIYCNTTESNFTMLQNTER